MGVAHVVQIVGEFGRQLAVRQRAVALGDNAPPRSDVHFVDRHRFVQALAIPPLGHPRLIVPLIIQVPNDRGELGRDLVEDGVGVGLVDRVTIEARTDVILVERALADVRNEAFPDARGTLGLQTVTSFLPAVELANDTDVIGVGRPHREVGAIVAVGAGDAAARDHMSAQFIVQPKVAALVEQI